MSTQHEATKGFEKEHNAQEQPGIVTEEHLLFLDDLRESGVTNMFGARPYIQEEFPELTAEEAGTVLSYWMKTFGERHKK